MQIIQKQHFKNNYQLMLQNSFKHYVSPKTFVKILEGLETNDMISEEEKQYLLACQINRLRNILHQARKYDVTASQCKPNGVLDLDLVFKTIERKQKTSHEATKGTANRGESSDPPWIHRK